MGKKPKSPSKDKDEPTRLRKSYLAAELGISRVTLDSYLNRTDPPPPRADNKLTYSIEEVATYISKIRIDEGKIKGASYWASEKSRLQCEEIADRIARDRGDYISKAEASKAIVPLMQELGDLMRQKFVLELPSRCRGKDAVEIGQLCEEYCDSVIKRFRQGSKGLVAA